MDSKTLTSLAAVVVLMGLAPVSSALAFTGFSTYDPYTRTVDCSEGRSIQKALNRAEPGEKIKVLGSCTESIVIRKDRIKLVCGDGAGITGPENPAVAIASTITVRATNVSISGCIISGPPSNGTGITVHRSSSADISGNTISGLRTGVAILQSSYGGIVNQNQIMGNANGVAVTSGAHADVAGNNISLNSVNGISIARNASADMVDNDIKNNGNLGIRVADSSHGAFSNDIVFGITANRISGNGNRGIFCTTSSSVRFGVPQDFGSGNGGPIGSSNWLFVNFCASAGFPGPNP